MALSICENQIKGLLDLSQTNPTFGLLGLEGCFPCHVEGLLQNLIVCKNQVVISLVGNLTLCTYQHIIISYTEEIRRQCLKF